MSIHEYRDGLEYLLHPTHSPALAYFYDNEENSDFQSGISVVKRLDRIFNPSIMDIVTVNCSRTKFCQQKLIEPLPSFHLFVPNYSSSLEFTNEHQLFPVIQFIQSNTKIDKGFWKNAIPKTKVEKVEFDNYTNFLGFDGCKVLLYYIEEHDSMSSLFKPTFEELSSIFYSDYDVKFGKIDCGGNASFCYHMGIQKAPLVIVYNGSNMSKYVGIRELPYLLKFINEKCGKQRKINGEIDFEYPQFNKYIKQFMENIHDKNKQKAIISNVAKLEKSDLCVKLMKRFMNDNKFINAELDKVNKIINSLSLPKIYTNKANSYIKVNEAKYILEVFKKYIPKNLEL